jgi:transposase
MTAVPLRSDFDAAALRFAAKKTKDAAQARRLLALAAVYDGAMGTEAAKIGDVTVQIVRDWVVKFNAQGPDGLIDRKAPGQPPKLNDTHRTALMKMMALIALFVEIGYQAGCRSVRHGSSPWTQQRLRFGLVRSRR